MKIAALILAAGRASRFAGPESKVLAQVDGVAMVRRVALAAQAADLPVYVVTGYQSERIGFELSGLKVNLIDNPRFIEGMSTSLQAGLAAMPANIDGVIVLLADMPKINAALIRDMVASFTAMPKASALVPVFDGERGNPVILSRSLFPQVMQLTGDQGARKLLERADAVVEFPVNDASIRLDIDTREALAALKSK
eukprot:gene15493-15638_t